MESEDYGPHAEVSAHRTSRLLTSDRWQVAVGPVGESQSRPFRTHDSMSKRKRRFVRVVPGAVGEGHEAERDDVVRHHDPEIFSACLPEEQRQHTVRVETALTRVVQLQFQPAQGEAKRTTSFLPMSLRVTSGQGPKLGTDIIFLLPSVHMRCSKRQSDQRACPLPLPT